MTLAAAAVTLFLIMDPLGNLPLFVSALDRVPAERQSRVLMRELLIALGLMVAFLYAGRPLLNVLHLRQEAVSIGGGIVLFLIALKMVFPPAAAGGEAMPGGEPFIVPLAVPLVAGPSVLAALLLLMNEDSGRHLEWLAALSAAWLANAAILMFSKRIAKMIGRRGQIAIERLMGMLLVMLAVQMFLDGVAAYLAGATPATSTAGV